MWDQSLSPSVGEGLVLGAGREISGIHQNRRGLVQFRDRITPEVVPEYSLGIIRIELFASDYSIGIIRLG